ncbi:MAG: AAA family ATPase [Desulfobacterales bacterium]|nr:AAA family ATPase [Desulfobacterales bacterium]
MILSSSITIFAVFITIVVILLCASIYFYFYNRFAPSANQASNVASLEQKKSLLLAEIEQCQKWLTDNKDELLKVEAERKKQEEYRKELEIIVEKLASKEEEMRKFHNDCNNYQNEILVANRERDSLLRDKEQITEQTTRLTEQLEHIKQEMKDAVTNAQKVKVYVEKLLKKESDLKETIQTLNGKIEADEQRLVVAQKEYNNIQIELPELKEKQAYIETAIQQAVEKQKEAEYLAEDTRIKSNAIVLKLDVINTELIEKQNILNTLNLSVAEKNITLNTIEQQIVQKQSITEQLEHLKTEKKNAEIEAKNTKANTEELLLKETSLKEQLAKLQSSIKEAERNFSLVQEQYRNIQKALPELTKKQEGIETDIQGAVRKKDNINTELIEKQNILNTLNLSVAEKNITLNTIEQQIVQKQSITEQLEHLKTEKKNAEIEAKNTKANAEELLLKENSLKEHLVKLQSSIKEAERNFSVVQEQSRNIQKALPELTKKQEGIEADIQQAVRKKDIINTEMNEKQNILNALSLNMAERKIGLNTLEARVARLQEEEKRLKVKTEEVKTVDPYQSLYQKPTFFSDLSTPYDANHSEEQALLDFKEYLKKCKLDFHERVINSFHTSLKIVDISPLLVMAGISGTGKSELPRRYAEAMGMHCLLLPVQPRWDSPQDIFGFYNYLEQQYKPTELSQALVFMDRWNHKTIAEFHDRLLIVLLDEMNLAKPEYYFSEFLSRLETRRSINPDIADKRRDAEISLDIGKYGEGIKIPHLYVHNNVMFIGTMNEDESTQTLSDKVIDRANIIRFNRPKKMKPDIPKGSENTNKKYLPLSVWNRWREDSYTYLRPEIYTTVESWVSKINNSLADIGRPFGFRINQTIFAYLANYPQVNYDKTFRYAFADQLEQKILPKLRGLDIHENSDCFEVIKNIIEELNDQELFDAYEKATKDKYMFTWHGVSRENNDNG